MNDGVSINNVFIENMRFSECSGIRLNEMKSEVVKLISETTDFASKRGTSEEKVLAEEEQLRCKCLDW